ncbi:MAG TPA: protocatechuate 3,4-dioxygenase [Terriglobia bacterium]|nr:protocatechuate 3,4-dioxygenase [Terriglobia bacterium]
MAEIVLGIGSSHGPLLSTPPDQWHLRAEDDRVNTRHFFNGQEYDYDSLLRARAPGFASQIDDATRKVRYARSQRGLDMLARKFKDVAPDAMVIIGNDQREIFSDELTPAITIYRGAEIPNIPHNEPESSPGLAIAEQGNCPPDGATYPGAPEFADHIIRSVSAEGFDLTQSTTIPKNATRAGIPHAYGFIYHRLMADAPPPSVPVILNVHYAPNQPSVARCLALGRSLRTAIRGWEGHKRVAIVASGGLSHFVINEALDHIVLRAMATADEESLERLPENLFQSGTAEVKNWLPLIAAMNAEGRAYHRVDYVPCYRSEAGTGNAMAFVYWE